MRSSNWQAQMLSADEAMLGSIPDREAPLPYIPKAGLCLPQQRPRVNAYDDLILHHPAVPRACSPLMQEQRFEVLGEAYPRSFTVSPPQSYVVRPQYPNSGYIDSFIPSAAPVVATPPYDGWPDAHSQASAAAYPSYDRSYPTTSGGSSSSSITAGNEKVETMPKYLGGEQTNAGWRSASVPSPKAPPIRSLVTSAPSPLEPEWRSSEVWSRASPAPCPLGCTIGRLREVQPGFTAATMAPAQVAAASGYPTQTSPCISPCATPQSPCRVLGLAEAQAQTGSRSATVLPLYTAPSSPCLSPCATPQLPCRPEMYVDTQASVIPVYTASASPCISPSATPQSASRPVSCMVPVVPVLAAPVPTTSYITPCATPQSPCRPVSYIAPQASFVSTSLSSCTPQVPCRAAATQAPSLLTTSSAVAMPSPAPFLATSSGFWTTRPGPQAASRSPTPAGRSLSPLRCLPVKYSRQMSASASAAPPSRFEDLLDEARRSLKQKVDSAMSRLMRTDKSSSESDRPGNQRVSSAEPRSTSLPPENEDRREREKPRMTLRAQEQVTPPPRAISGRNLGDKEPPKSSAPSTGLDKLKAVLAESSKLSKLESPRRRPSDDAVQRSQKSEALAAPSHSLAQYRPTSQSSQSLASLFTSPTPLGLEAKAECPKSSKSSAPPDFVLRNDDDLRRSLFASGFSSQDHSLSPTAKSRLKVELFDGNQDWISKDEKAPRRSRLGDSQSLPTLCMGREPGG
ncbi:unnamed protein product, partial [Durusdinium trenchii]